MSEEIERPSCYYSECDIKIDPKAMILVHVVNNYAIQDTNQYCSYFHLKVDLGKKYQADLKKHQESVKKQNTQKKCLDCGELFFTTKLQNNYCDSCRDFKGTKKVRS